MFNRTASPTSARQYSQWQIARYSLRDNLMIWLLAGVIITAALAGNLIFQLG
jgi:hypothetical protein